MDDECKILLRIFISVLPCCRRGVRQPRYHQPPVPPVGRGSCAAATAARRWEEADSASRADHGPPNSCKCRRGAPAPRRGPCVQARRFDVMRDGGERLSLQQHNGAAVVGHRLAHEGGGGESDARRHQQVSEIEHRRRVEDTVIMLAAGQAGAARRKARWSRSPPRKEAPEPYPPQRCRVRRCHQGEAPRIWRGATLLSFALACDTLALCCPVLRRARSAGLRLWLASGRSDVFQRVE